MILAIALSIAVLLGYQYLAPTPPQRAAQNAAAPSKDNAAPAAGVPAAVPSAPSAGIPGAAAPSAAAAAAPVRTIRIKTPLYTAAVSTDGGALASFRLDGPDALPPRPPRRTAPPP